ncbi:type II secretion system protein E [Methanoregula boonei 6A8]|jgi:flagellar protein FlaI|uniref:Type II secretion system protein E n=1 Tax=Methanoregula boonei (strain DSM 21154 / JCM 14090 / 6A8) TaxID=456442 RepID=A7IAY9_METB6|nr:type II/IV secretion system ATPase subunit [Methanoregula boonei]ABS56900.1 type II secretion system protein E [Methanoregula boonei 6A8]
MSPEFQSLSENLGTSYRKTIAAFSQHSARGSLLLVSTGLASAATGVGVLFVDLPILLMGILSVVSLAALILFVAGVRARFFPPHDRPIQEITEPAGSKMAKGGKISGLPAPCLRLVRLLGNRTDRGDAGILAIFIVAVATGYTALFVDLPLALLVASGLISLVMLVTVGLAAGFRFIPEKMMALLPESRQYGIPIQNPTGQSARTFALTPLEPGGDLPEKQSTAILDVYWVESPFAYVKLARQGNLGFVYTVVEPALSPREKIVLQETYNYLRDVIVFDNPEKSPQDLLSRENVWKILHENDPSISHERLPILEYYLHRDLSGFGILEPLMHDPALEDISCNGENLPVFVFHRVHGSLRTSVTFRKGELNQFVLKLAQKANKQISLTNPMVDAALPDGSRVQVTYSNVISTNGSSFTIRKFRSDPMTPLDLIKFGTYNSEILAFLWLVIEHRRSLIIAGGTASGKTSTMNALSLFIPLNSKIVSLEDTREIQLPHKNWLATQTRELTMPGAHGDVDLFSLLKSSMRQRPEYIIVGEVRGKEAQTLFQAMNTGHATLSTIHAGSVQEAINRLTHEPINVPPVMFTALDIVVNQAVFTFGSMRVRRCSAIHEISVDDQGNIIPVKLFEWDTASQQFRKTGMKSKVLDEIAAMGNWSTEQVADELRRREEFLKIAVDVPTPDIIDLANAIADLGE